MIDYNDYKGEILLAQELLDRRIAKVPHHDSYSNEFYCSKCKCSIEYMDETCSRCIHPTDWSNHIST